MMSFYFFIIIINYVLLILLSTITCIMCGGSRNCTLFVSYRWHVVCVHQALTSPSQITPSTRASNQHGLVRAWGLQCQRAKRWTPSINHRCRRGRESRHRKLRPAHMISDAKNVYERLKDLDASKTTRAQGRNIAA